MSRLLGLTALGLAAATAPAFAQPAAYPAADRYGPAPVATPSTPYGDSQAAAGPAPWRGRVLSWAGKVAPQAPPMSAPPAGAAYAQGWTPAAYGQRGRSSAANRPAASAWRPAQPQPAPAVSRSYGRYASASPQPDGRYGAAFTPASYGPPMAGAPVAGPAANPNAYGWRPVFAPQAAGPANGSASASVPQGAAPTSIYAPAAQGFPPSFAAARAAPPPNRAYAADRRYGYDPTQDHSVRFYSVSRPFGLKPDPAPIPPQFFTATADLDADPPGPLPVNHTTATTRAAVVGGDTGGQ